MSLNPSTPQPLNIPKGISGKAVYCAQSSHDKDDVCAAGLAVRRGLLTFFDELPAALDHSQRGLPKPASKSDAVQAGVGCFTTTSWSFSAMHSLDFLAAVAPADKSGGPGRVTLFKGAQWHVKGKTAEGFGAVIVPASLGGGGTAGGLLIQLELPARLAIRAEEVYAEMCGNFSGGVVK